MGAIFACLDGLSRRMVVLGAPAARESLPDARVIMRMLRPDPQRSDPTMSRRESTTTSGACSKAGSMRPHYDREVVHRELEIIKDDLHCNAVKVQGLDIRA